MQKEKSVKSYTRRTKSGKTVVVHAYKAKYDAAEEMRKALAKKEGAGKELADKKKQVEQPTPDDKLGFSAEEFKAWYHWDMVDDPKNKAALKVEKALKKSMGVKAYNKFLDDMTDGYSVRGHNKAFKGLESSLSSQNKETSTKETTAKRATAETDKSKSSKKDTLLTHYDQFNRKYEGKRVGKSFTLSDDLGTYDAQFVTDGKGRYGVVVKDREDGVNGKYYVALESQEEPAIKRAAKKLGLSYDDKTGEWRETTKSKPTSKDTSTKGKTSTIHVDDKVVRQYAKDEDISLKTAREEFRGMSKRDQLSIKSNQEKYAKGVQKRAEASAPKSVKSIESKLAKMTHLSGDDAKQAVKLLQEAGYKRKKVTYQHEKGHTTVDWALVSPDGKKVYMSLGGNMMLKKGSGDFLKQATKSVTPVTKGKTPATHVTDEAGRKHSTKRNSLGISPAEWAAYNSGGVGIKGMSDKEVKATIKHVESTLKKNLGSKVKTFKAYLDDTAQDGGDFKADMKKLQGIMSAKDKSPKKREVKSKQDNPHPFLDTLVDTFGMRDKMMSKRERTAYEKKRGYTRGGKYQGHQILERNGKAYKWDFFGSKLFPLNKRETTEYFERRNRRTTSK